MPRVSRVEPLWVMLCASAADTSLRWRPAISAAWPDCSRPVSSQSPIGIRAPRSPDRSQKGSDLRSPKGRRLLLLATSTFLLMILGTAGLASAACSRSRPPRNRLTAFTCSVRDGSLHCGADPSSCGVRGPQGLRGVAGATGAAGTAGNVGAQGAQGLRGSAGAGGAAEGAPGATGTTGTAGPEGNRGPQGDSGAAGSTGTTGPPGGATGSTGATGNAGVTGATGPAGAQGSTGTAGAAGTTGSAGATGAPGTTGNAGAAGADRQRR
jgi:Collagen triple helix repeat (20 copies)